MQHIPHLSPGDRVEIIAPASRCTDLQLTELKELLLSWELQVIVADDIFGEDLLCANTDIIRFRALSQALQHPENKAVICARGGYGSARLLPELIKLPKPSQPKWLVGMSDITALLLFVQQHWQWPTLHGALGPSRFTAESTEKTRAFLFGDNTRPSFSAVALNAAARETRVIQSSITGGNLCLVQTGIGTAWQIDAREKIIFLEEVEERGFRVDRMLEHMQQANIFKNALAIVIGDFLKGNEPDGSSTIQPVLERFANQCKIPVIQIEGVGHGRKNFPLPMGMPATLTLGSEIQLRCL